MAPPVVALPEEAEKVAAMKVQVVGGLQPLVLVTSSLSLPLPSLHPWSEHPLEHVALPNPLCPQGFCHLS
jgi:hypothetical protein